ncbi:SusC/RagA family TonB-linked outer membrane protein [Parabacteroides merdae]|nr:TonB-dependent receptor [Parabacteroides merdae]
MNYTYMKGCALCMTLCLTSAALPGRANAESSAIVNEVLQSSVVKGVVKDSNGEPLLGVNVLVKGTTIGAVTDIDGNFSFEAPAGCTLVISYIGFESQEVKVKGNAPLNIILKEDSEALDEVVVIGYGTQKKVNLTGAVSAVTGEEIAKRPVSNTSTMLQGQMPGLRITSDKGQPGNESVQMRVRGQGTYSSAGSNPLVLINGVEGDLATLDPNIIESVSVLKDAASASIYGSRAANGVILITTKNGSEMKERVSVRYNGNFAVHNPTTLLDLIWDSPTYMKYFNMAKENSGSPITERYTQEMIDAYTNPTDPQKYPSFNWLDYMFDPAFVQQHNVNVSGTIGKTSYNASLSMVNQPGTMKGQEYQRYNASLDLTSQVNDWVKIGMYFTGSRSYRQETRQGDTDAYLSTISQAPTYMPWLPDDGSGIKRYTSKAYTFESNNKNMVAIAETENFKKYVNTDANVQAWAEIKPFKGLTWYTKGAIRYKAQHYKDWGAIPTPIYFYHDGTQNGTLNTNGTGLTSNMEYSTYVNLYTYLKYDWLSSNKDHSLSAMAGYSLESYRYDVLQGYRQDYDFPLHELNAGNSSVQTNSGSSQEWGLVSGFFRLNYGFKDRYLVELNARYDGSSRIASQSRWGVFPSFSLGWRVTEEEWMKDLQWDWLNSLKLRGSWGLLGNQNIDLYSYYALVSTGKDYGFNNTDLSSGVAQTAISNQNLKWETTAIGDFGADLTLFNGFNVTFDWYKKRTYDILRKAQGNALLGLDAPYINDGEMVNKGIEVSLGYNGYVRDGFFEGLSYNANVYFDRSRNTLTKYGADYITNGLICSEGLPYESFYGYKAIGIFKDDDEVRNSPKQFNDNTQAGDIKYADISGPDGVPDNVVDEYDRTIIGNRFPNFEYSVSLGASWRGFDLSLLGQGVSGVDHYASGWGLRPFYQGTPISQDYIDNMWTEEHTNAKYPRLYFADMGGTKNQRESTYWLYDGSYFRLKNLTFGYTLPKALTQKAKIQRLRVYFSGDNLLTFTKFPQGGDPERNYNSTKGTRLVYYPQNRIISFGINLDF